MHSVCTLFDFEDFCIRCITDLPKVNLRAAHKKLKEEIREAREKDREEREKNK